MYRHETTDNKIPVPPLVCHASLQQLYQFDVKQESHEQLIRRINQI